MRDIDELGLAKRRKEGKGRAKKDRAKRHRAQGLTSLHREPLPPVHRCPTQVEATIFNYPVIRTSTELLKVVLHTTMSSIFWLRELLPLDSFGVRDLPVCLADESFTYEEHFMNGSFTPEEPLPRPLGADQVMVEKGNEKTSEDIAHWLETGRFSSEESLPRRMRVDQIMVMERGKDRNTDQIVDWLENGIFHRSLLKRRLLGLQVAVCKDKNNLLDVYETYTISIDYSGRRGSSEPKIPREKDRAKMDFQDPKEDYLSSLQVKEGIMAMFRKLSILTSHLSALPDDRRIMLHVFHPPFVELPRNKDWEVELSRVLSFPKIPGWRRETFDCGFVDTGFYGARLQVNYLKPPIRESLAGIPIPKPKLDVFTSYKRQADNLKFEYGTDWVRNYVDTKKGRREAADMNRRLKRALSDVSPSRSAQAISWVAQLDCRRATH